MSDRTKERIFCLFSNTIRVIVFAWLAVTFQHWWIVLLSILFMSCRPEDAKAGRNDYNAHTTERGY